MSGGGVVIVGAGECGARAALALREESYAGRITLIGAERHLPYERPPLSKEGMAAEAPGMKTIAEAQHFETAGIELMLGVKVVKVDRATQAIVLEGEERIPYERLLLTTGARPRRLPLADSSEHCLYLRTHDDANAIAARLQAGARIVIVGGGLIGLELAAAAHKRACAVTVVEALPRLLSRAVPPEIAAVLAEEHHARGVEIRCGQVVTAVTDDGGCVDLRLNNGDTITADLCIVGIGSLPNAELAADAGLATDNGICVDELLSTADPSILAAGDCCSFPLSIYGGRRVRLESWRSAQEHGNLAAKSILGRNEHHPAVPWFWSDQYGLTLQVAGLIDEGKKTVRREAKDGGFLLFHLNGEDRLVAASGVGPGNAIARDIRLAEMLIARRAAPPADKLTAANVNLKSLLAG